MSLTDLHSPTAHDNLTTWLSYWGNIHVSAIDLGLERVMPVAKRLGILTPDSTVFTVAGTNGKGSTTSTIAAILQAQGYRVALYQSPHIYRFNERISINGHVIADADLIAAFVAVEHARLACGLTLSFFEATTLAAFYYFKQHCCDVWVLEIGLGGRLDVVNIIDADVAVITNIGFDHVDWLGDTIEKIAFEKAGIIRPNIPVIFAADQALPQAIAEQVALNNAHLYQYQHDYFFNTSDQSTPDSDHHQVKDWYFSSPQLTLALPQGQLATINQAAAVMAVLSSDLNISADAIRVGVQNARLAGRFQVVEYQGRTIILDVAHNSHGVEFLKQQLQQFLASHPQYRQVVAVFSMLADKDIASVTQALSPMIKAWYIAALDVPRAAPLVQLQAALAVSTAQTVQVASSVSAAFQHAMQTDSDTLIVVCGSFHTIEAVWEYIFHGNE